MLPFWFIRSSLSLLIWLLSVWAQHPGYFVGPVFHSELMWGFENVCLDQSGLPWRDRRGGSYLQHLSQVFQWRHHYSSIFSSNLQALQASQSIHQKRCLFFNCSYLIFDLRSKILAEFFFPSFLRDKIFTSDKDKLDSRLPMARRFCATISESSFNLDCNWQTSDSSLKLKKIYNSGDPKIGTPKIEIHLKSESLMFSFETIWQPLSHVTF